MTMTYWKTCPLDAFLAPLASLAKVRDLDRTRPNFLASDNVEDDDDEVLDIFHFHQFEK